jgi:hypothetical protein
MLATSFSGHDPQQTWVRDWPVCFQSPEADARVRLRSPRGARSGMPVFAWFATRVAAVSRLSECGPLLYNTRAH